MKIFKLLATLAALTMAISSCGRAVPATESAIYEREVRQWREDRLARLKEPAGFLNQVGLFWLAPGNHRFGSAPDNDVRFPQKAAAHIGLFEVGEHGVWMRVTEGVDVLSEGQPVQRLFLSDDTSESPVQVTQGSIGWMVIKRDARFAVRVRDFEHPFLEKFGPLPYYPIDASLRVSAILQRYAAPKIANVGTVIEGLGYHPESPGLVKFEIDGEPFSLEAYASDDRLFFVFGDATNRDETYGAGRFLYAEMPGADGETVLDFNRSYSPPCAFNDFSTCPVASARNRLPIRIEAGEKYDPALHYSAGSDH